MIEVIFTGTLYDVQAQYNSMDQYEKERLFNVKVRTSIECHTTTHYYIFIILDENSKELYENVLETNNILYICNDITDDVVNNLNRDVLSFINQTLGSNLHIDYYEFKEEFNDWIYDQLTIDGILDRIGQYGMENLRDIDYEFLENNE